MDEDTRDKLKEELAELSKAEASIREARRPFDLALTAVDTVRKNLLEKHSVEIAGGCERCESCERLLFTGDQGYRCEEGEVLCEGCAPTFADAKAEWDAYPDDDIGRRDEFMKSLQAHLAGGGAETDKLPLCEL